MSTSNKRILTVDPIRPPSEFVKQYPLSSQAERLVENSRAAVSDILHKRDDRMLVVVGPCSIHDPQAALEYAQLLRDARQEHSDSLEIVMRVYFEKPRTTIGWKGLINDPDLNQSFDVNKGLGIARRLLLEINELGVPAGCEFLDAVTGQYYADLVSWGAIGARTTESQVHRELASGLSCPVGFKNGTNGDIDIAADAVVAARSQHIFLSPTEEGNTALFKTAGNDDGHIILRGGREPNFDAKNVALASKALQERGITTGLMIDMSHANSRKQHQNQMAVGENIASQISEGNTDIVSCMIESNLVAGRQDIQPEKPLIYGQSITDACIDFEQTNVLINSLAQAVRKPQELNASLARRSE